MELLHHPGIFVATEAELQLTELFPECLDLIGDNGILYHHIMHQFGQCAKVIFLHAESCHLRYSHTQSPGRGESLFVCVGLIVTYDVVGFEPARDFRPVAVTYVHDHLVGFSKVNGRVSGHIQPALLQGTGKCLGIGDDSGLVFVLELIHLVSSHEQPE